MKKLFTCIALLLLVGTQTMQAKDEAKWTPVSLDQAPPKYLLRIPPSDYLVYRLDVAALKAELWALPSAYEDAKVMSLPMADGSFREFRVWETSMMPQSLAAQYPDIKTFTAEAVNDARVTAKIDFTLFGFHAVVFDGDKLSFTDPYDNLNDGYYYVHYKINENRPFSQRMVCGVKSDNDLTPAGAQLETMQPLLPGTNLAKIIVTDPSNLSTAEAAGGAGPGIAEGLLFTSGSSLRTYRLALSADNWYCRAATGLTTPTIGQCFSAMTTSMNRVNGVYNRELSVQLNFCTNENLIIWPTATGSSNGADPFDAIDGSGPSCLPQNQTTCDTRIGNGNYDIGHVFTTGGGGIASVGVVCNNTFKAQGVTGLPMPVGDAFDIDYVCHEMGHQFGSSHTFNNNADGSCNGTASTTHAYEPASGATIMDYAGICSPDNIQPHSDAYFSISSLQQIGALITGAGSEVACAVSTSSGHSPATAPGAFSATYNIPYKTPFELSGPAYTGSAGDTAITYGWCQYNLGDFGMRLNQTYVHGPIFRSYQPVYSNARVFPRLSDVLAGVLSNSGEKAPDTARFLTFKTVVRNIRAGLGCFAITDDTMHLNVSSTGAANGYAGFKVTSQNTTGIVYTGGSTQTVTWNVVGTNGAPVSAANVDIFMSVDGGNTWAYTVGTFPNNGTASISVPNPGSSTSTARFKVKGSGNVFFNINSNNFTVNPGAATAPIAGTFTVCVTGTTTLSDATPLGTWTSSTPGVATIGSSSGTVTGVSAGTTTITYNVASGPVTAVVTVNAVPAPGAISGSSLVCMGTPVTLTNGTPSGVWTSTDITHATVGSSSGVVTGVAPGTAIISYTVTNGCGSGSAVKTVTVGATTAVAAITGSTTVCPAASSTLSDVTPSGVWSSTNPSVATINSSGVATGVSVGTTTISYAVTNASGCVTASTVTFTVGAAVTPSVSIDAVPNDTLCVGQSVTYNAVASGGGAAPTYQWTVNGINVATGPSYTTTSPANGDVIVCQMMSTASCISSATASSAPLTITVQTPTTNPVYISSGTTSIVAGENVTFAAIAPNAGPGATYQWFIDILPVPGATAATFTTNAITNGQTVYCKVTSMLPCVLPNISMSNGIRISVATGVLDISNSNSFTLNPNPNNGSFVITGRLPGLQDANATIVVSNILGQVVSRQAAAIKNGKMNEHVTLPAGTAKGTYVISVYSGQERSIFRMTLD